MSLALLILCLVIVAQVLKIIIKTSVIDKNLIDYVCEYLVLALAFVGVFFRKDIQEDILRMLSCFCVIYELLSGIYTYYRYFKKEKLNNFSIKNLVDSSDIGILVLKGKKKILTNSTMSNILNEVCIKDKYIKNIIKNP